jgi:hypothetical protein
MDGRIEPHANDLPVLIRSLGGWAEVLALRARGQSQTSDQRVLGDGEFVQQKLSEMDALSKENLRVKRKGIDLSSLAKKVCDVMLFPSGNLDLAVGGEKL